MKVVRCLSCEHLIDVGDHPRLFQEISCTKCGQRFVIIEIYPVEICYPLEDDQKQGTDPDLAFSEGEPLDY